MKNLFKIDSQGVLEIQASQASVHTDFDFYIGKWSIRNRKLKDRLCASTEWLEFDSTDDTMHLLKGQANLNKFKAVLDGEEFEGLALRLFDPLSKLWSIYWADSKGVKLDPPMIGSFEDNIGKFYCMDTCKGQRVLG